MADDDEMRPSEVAAYLDVSTATVRRWAIDGTLKPSRVFPGSGYRRYSRREVKRVKTEMEGTSPPSADQ